MIKAAERPAWLRRDLITDSHRRSSALAEHLERLKAGGETIHASAGDSMAFLIDGLEKARVRYRIEAKPGYGYKIITGDLDV